MQIEKGIPMPFGKRGKLKNIAEKMEVGDSVLCDGDGYKSAKAHAASLIGALNRLGAKGISRPEQAGVRVWRTA